MSKNYDEYDDIYDQYEGSGFEFEYKNRKIGKSIVIFKDTIDELPESKHNEDDIPLFVHCHNCTEYMDYVGGKWKCPVCGKGVRETTLYIQLEKENEQYQDNDYEEYFRGFDD